MKKTFVHFACAATFLLGSAALAGAQRPPQPAPPPQQPTPQEQREQAEREQAEKRKQRAREQAEAQQQEDAKRAARAREQQQANPPANTPANPRQRAANADQAQVRQDLYQLERNHREIIARLDRLADLYRESGQERQLAEVEALRAKHHQRYERFLSIYREKLGPDEFAAVDSNLRMGRERRMANARPRVDAKSGGSDTPQKQ